MSEARGVWLVEPPSELSELSEPPRLLPLDELLDSLEPPDVLPEPELPPLEPLPAPPLLEPLPLSPEPYRQGVRLRRWRRSMRVTRSVRA
ncbi:hypothetical protein ACFY12_26380 [Streptomyces sp. NPDC001339]|uniref:hypothetical protein n=1 Tax=Streptomyces sp. NPDC001339 TaxID=3364563 RepID=UPI0036863119